MAATQQLVKSMVVIRIRSDNLILLQESLAPQTDDHWSAVKATFPDFTGFDKNRKDKGKIDKKDFIIYYQIDSESLGYLLSVEKSYSEKAAHEMLSEAVNFVEKNVEEVEDKTPSQFQKSVSSKVQTLLKKYANRPSDADDEKKVTPADVNNKLEKGMNKMRENLEKAAQNQQKLTETEEASRRAKLLAEDMNYDTEGLRDTMSWRNKKLYIIAAIIGGLVFTVLIILLLK